MTMEEFYRTVGGSYADTLSRLPSEAMICRFLRKFPEDPAYAELEQTCDAGGETAFRAAHTLKGVAQNLGFSRLAQSASALTEQLRERGCVEDTSLRDAVRRDYAEVLAALDALFAEL